jgi:hypothetical protein
VAAPLRGTQSLVGQMGWVISRPSLTFVEVAWRWIFGVPFLAICWMQAKKILVALPPESAGLSSIDAQNPWVAATQIAHVWALYRPHVAAVTHWLAPLAAIAWVIVSGLGRSVLLVRLGAGLGKRIPFRPLSMIVLQAVWFMAFGVTCWGWFRAVGWVAGTHITSAGEPDLIGFSIWLIFLSLAIFTAWALMSWPVSIAPLLMLLEERSAPASLGLSFKLGKAFTGKVIEINLVMGIVKLALIVLAMVFSAAPLPFSDQLGGDALHVVWAASLIFYLVASDYFQVVRLRSFTEFWRVFRGSGSGS